MSLGNNIKRIRESKGISIDDLVKKINIFKEIYLNIERDLIKPKPTILNKIAVALGVTERDIRNINEDKFIEDANLKRNVNLRNLDITFNDIAQPKINRGSIFSKRPILIKVDEFEEIKEEIKIVGENNNFTQNSEEVIEVDPLEGLISDEGKTFSPKLLNWVEPYTIAGVRKTLFYTEVNSGLKKGDRVFIINGNYDSDLAIKSNKYKINRDGYKVLLVDKCRIVLDIDYQGLLPYEDEPIDNFINVNYIKDYYDFVQVNRQITTKNNKVDYKYSAEQNNIVYSDQDFNGISGWGETTGLTGSPGFFIKGTASWINITNYVISGDLSPVSSATSSTTGKLRISNESFTYSIGPSIVEFKKDYIYKWDQAEENDGIAGTYSTWIVDVIYNKPHISKGNFRGGLFKGRWNGGLYGRSDKKIRWRGGSSKWLAGTLLNTKWESGIFDTLYTLSESYLSEIDSTGLPFQKVNEPNNNGFGFNYAIDSEFDNTTINNGNFLNSKIGLNNLTYSIVENYILSESTPTSININKGLFDSCSLLGANISNSDIRKSILLNSRINNSKSVNSSFKSSVINESSYISDEVIKILRYEEQMISEGAINGSSHKVYKFFLSRRDYESLKLKERFYIKGLRIVDNSLPINFFDRRFRISTWTEYKDEYLDGTSTISGVLSNSFYKRGFEVGVFLSTPQDNKWRYNTFFDVDYYTDVTSQDNNAEYSIDIVVSIYDKNLQLINGLDYNTNSGVYGTSSTTISNSIDISSAYILNSDFESGLFEKSDWLSGYHINYQNDVNITNYTNEGGFYNLEVVTQSSTIIANTLFDVDTTLPESGKDCLEVGNIVFLNSVYYDTSGKVDNLQISSSGTGYITATGLSVSGSSLGEGLVIDIIADIIGSVTSTSISASGSSYGFTFSTAVVASGGSGSGLLLDVTATLGGSVTSVVISDGGIGYQVGNTVSIPGGTPEAIIQIDTITNGELLSTSVSTGGIGYNAGDILTVQDGDFNATIQVISTTGSVVRLPDTYKITDNQFGELTLQDINGTSSVIQSLLDGGRFWTPGAKNRWGYIHKAKINKSKIRTGILRGSYIKESIIENFDYNTSDKDFTSLQNIKSLIISDTLFVDNGNTLSKGLYINSNIVSGSDNYIDGIVYNSIWNGSTFLNGTFKESTWIDGVFKNGTFYKCNSFDASPTLDYQYYYTDRIRTYYKSGATSPAVSNNRYSWQNGTFSGGLFSKSDWESGQFNDGVFNYSKFYSGTINGGIFGDKSIQADKTRVYNGTVNKTTAVNAYFYADDTSYSSLIGYNNVLSNILWRGGVFESGIFGARPSELKGFDDSVNAIAVQDDGKFIIGGSFTSYGNTPTGSYNRIIRFNANNSIDNTFNIGTGFGGTVNAIAIQDDGKIIVGGSFTTYDGNTWNRIIRLEEDGTIDTTFNIGTGFGGTVNAIAVQDDGKIIIGGDFTSYDGNTWNRIIRLNTDGTEDGTFVIGTGFGGALGARSVLSIIIESTGDILIGGSFETYNSIGVEKLVRLSTTGIIDNAFDTNLSSYGIFSGTTPLITSVNTIAIQVGDKIIIGGHFGDAHPSLSIVGHIKRIETDGTIDSTFLAKLGNIESPIPNAINFVKSVVVQDNGKILVGGQFSAIWEPEENQTLSNIVRLDESGYVDTTFNGAFNSISGDSVNIIKFKDPTSLIIGGEFTSYNGVTNNKIVAISIDSIPTIEDSIHSATWVDGTFNGGQFVDSAKWRNGTFNGGKFLSGLGWKLDSSISQTDYTWEDGIFNGGEFGNSYLLRNSTWFTGEFNGGEFKGRTWNDGVLTNGNFFGSSTVSSVGGEKNQMSSDFVDSFKILYYGLWRDGIVSNNKDEFLKDTKIFTDVKRSDSILKLKSVNISNSLWLSGTFNHPTGVMNNCVWLDGIFKSGLFKSSSFNPYVKRDGGLTQSFNISDDTCYWENGDLDNSEFQISRWKGGRFLFGTATGMIWENGVANYMNAYNVFWEGGTWRNGNWYGSSILFDDIEVTDDWTKQILARGMDWSGTSSCHIWNIFGPAAGSSNTILDKVAATPVVTPTPDKWVSFYWALSSSALKRKLFTPAINGSLLYQLASTQTFGGGKTYTIRTEYNNMFTGAQLYIAPFGLVSYSSYYTGVAGATYSEITVLIPETISTNIAVEYKATYAQFNPAGITRVVISEVNTTPLYQLTDNNKQFLLTDSSDYYSSTFSVIGGSTMSSYQLTVETVDEDGATVSNTITSKIGNGLFKAGVWENGVWNSGWRKDEVVIEFDSIGVFFSTSTDSKRWRIFLKGNQLALDSYQIGDKVSIGNIVSIDINGERKLMKGVFTMINRWTSTDNNSFGWIVEYTSTFPLRKIELDSNKHKIKVTKNVWLSGAFLNGYFEGVWSGGLFKGYPYITEMYNTHMVDGIFDGGHFHSEYPTWTFTGSYGSLVDSKLKFGVTFSEVHGLVQGDEVTVANDDDFDEAGIKIDMKVLSVVNDYSVLFDRNYLGIIPVSFGATGSVKRNKATGLVQNFTFFDNNVATKTTADFSSLEMVDTEEVFNYNSWIDVNYNEDTATNIGRDQISFANKVEYSRTNLYGKTTDDVLSSLSSFKDSNTNELRVYNLGTKWKVFNDFLGRISEFNEPFQTPISMGNFYANGWTFSYQVLGTTGSGDLYNINREESESLKILIDNTPVGPTYSEFVLDNTNITMERSRYTLIEFDLKSYRSNTGTYSISDYYGIPGIWFRNEVVFTPDGEYIDHTKTTALKKSEFFFNRKKLDMILTNESGLEILFDNLKYYEVDMIPFFKYTTSDYINDTVQIPYQGVAPFIDYTNSQFVFIDNISFGLDSIEST